MAWFVLSLTVLWYALTGKGGPQVQRQRPWYRGKKGPTFADMLGALRLQLWQGRITEARGQRQRLGVNRSYSSYRTYFP